MHGESWISQITDLADMGCVRHLQWIFERVHGKPCTRRTKSKGSAAGARALMGRYQATLRTPG